MVSRFIQVENQEPISKTRDEFDAAIQENEETNQKYVIMYEYRLFKTLDKWDAYPKQVILDELECFYVMKFINKEVYLIHKASILLFQ